MGRIENTLIYNDTEKLCKEHPVLIESIKNSLAGQEIHLTPAPAAESRYDAPAKVIVSKKRSFEAASAYKDSKVCVHNFASAANPGGGVKNGASAQEEALCRCSTLMSCIDTKECWNSFYYPHRSARDPLHNDDCIYTPSVTVFKSDTASPKLMAEKDWFNADIITCAAPNLREKPSNSMNPGDGDHQVKITDAQLCELHQKRLRQILNVAVQHGAEVIILGAFGCGAFLNPPFVVAEAISRVLPDYLQCFKAIEFAVYCPPRDDTNYKVFSRKIKQN